MGQKTHSNSFNGLSDHAKKTNAVLPLSTSNFPAEDESDFDRNELNLKESSELRYPMRRTPKRSAGLIMYRRPKHRLEVFLVHPGGPFWAKKNEGAWTLPKGEYIEEEDPLTAAKREFTEETSFTAQGPFLELGSITQVSGKIVEAWAFEGDCDPSQLTSNTCLIEWPPRSGRTLEIPEVDQGRWYSIEEALENIRKEQKELLIRLRGLVKAEDG